MEIREMQMEDIEARKAEIAEEIDSEEADLDALTSEVDELNARSAEIKETAEKRSAIIEAVASGEGEVIEERKEEITMNEVYSVDSMEYRNAWLKSLQGNELNEVEARAYATTDSHTAIPTLVADKFFEKLKKVAPMIDEITCMRVAGNLKFVVEGTNNAADKHTENADISPAGDTIASVTLGIVEFAKIIKISKSVRAQSIDAFEGWLVDMLGRDIARAIDNYIVNDSSNGITKGTFTTNTNQVVSTSYEYKDICKLISMLPAGYDAGAKFLVSKKVLWEDLKGMVDTSKKPIFDPISKTLCGYPVLVDDYLPSTNKGLYLADWKEAVVGNFGMPLEVEASEEAGFMSGSIAFRGFAGFDSKLTQAGANIVRLVSTTA